MIIYTLGTSNRSFDEFVDILRRFEITSVVDVRRFPTSKFEHFKRESLEESLKNIGIGYEYLGDLLGGYREGGYERYMDSADFRKGLQRLMELAEREKIAVICKERFPWKCHRWHIASGLVGRGAEVVHIIDKESTYAHRKPIF